MDTAQLPRRERVGIVLVHGVGETEPGWINDFVINRLERCSPELKLAPYSEVHTLKDSLSSDAGAKFHVFLRRGDDGQGRDLAFMELFWANLSRIGAGPFTSMVAAVRLFYEAPMVFGSGALRHNHGGFLGVLRSLILLANWILRWPITGTNVAVFFCALIVLLMQRLLEIRYLNPWLAEIDIVYPIGATLALLAVGGLWMGRRLAHRDIALADVGLSTFVFSSLLLVVLIGASAYAPMKFDEFSDRPAAYLHMGAAVIMPIWFLWSATIALAIVLLGCLFIVRLLPFVPRASMPLARPAAALGLSTIQGVIWKIVVALLWVLLIGAVVRGSFDPEQCVGPANGSCKELHDLNVRLVIIVLFNMAMFAVLAATFILVVSLRMALRRLFPKSSMAVQSNAPRLIVSEVIVAVMFAATLFNFYSYYGPQAVELLDRYLGMTYSLPVDIVGWLSKNEDNRIAFRHAMTGIAGGTGVVAIYAYFQFVRSVQNASRGVLHIMRDLVDHQYTPRDAVGHWLLPKGKRYKNRYPRRERIQKRLDALMDTVVAAERLDRVIFVAHSQGSVILLDYLRTGRDDNDLAEARRIDVVTLASPLTHIYQHYFPAYAALNTEAHRLNPKLASWTNFWTIDDPIGNRVDVVNGAFIQNIPLEPGGHVDYWREPKVCDAIVALIREKPVCGLPKTPRQAVAAVPISP